MARMYSGSKGKSGSVKPSNRKVPSWLRYNPSEVEILVSKLAKEGKTPSQIGLYLRDVYGIPDVKLITKKSITKILEEKNLLSKIPEDLMALMKKSIRLRKHMEAHPHDFSTKRGLGITESKIRRLIKYYKRTKKLDQDWKYDPDKIRIMVE